MLFQAHKLKFLALMYSASRTSRCQEWRTDTNTLKQLLGLILRQSGCSHMCLMIAEAEVNFLALEALSNRWLGRWWPILSAKLLASPADIRGCTFTCEFINKAAFWGCRQDVFSLAQEGFRGVKGCILVHGPNLNFFHSIPLFKDQYFFSKLLLNFHWYFWNWSSLHESVCEATTWFFHFECFFQSSSILLNSWEYFFLQPCMRLTARNLKHQISFSDLKPFFPPGIQ